MKINVTTKWAHIMKNILDVRSNIHQNMWGIISVILGLEICRSKGIRNDDMAKL
jgi:hypothetical protein